ncbi:MAG: hypothetical protein OEN20_00770, partial [Gammaproteobacteria bacterium]|nr:hypothetical protein [Gammaproteobacteria bacterium]
VGTGVRLSIKAGLSDLDFFGSTIDDPGQQPNGIILDACYQARVSNVRLHNCGALFLRNCYQCEVEDLRCGGMTDSHATYAIAVSGDENIIRRMVGRDNRHDFTTSAQSSGVVRYGTNRRNLIEDCVSYCTGEGTVAPDARIGFDTHAEGYETTFRRCVVHAAGDEYDAVTATRVIAYNSRSRKTIYDQCEVKGDVNRMIRGFRISADDNVVRNCRVDGVWGAVVSQAAVALGPTPQRTRIIGGRFEKIRDSAVIIDGGDSHLVDGVEILEYGMFPGGLNGGDGSAVTFANDRDVADVPTNVAVRNSRIHEAAGRLSLSFGAVGFGDIAFEGNLFLGYQRAEIGLDRSVSLAAQLERKWASRNNRPDYRYLNAVGHGLSVPTDEYKPITTDGGLHDGTDVGGILAGVLVDVVDNDTLVLAHRGQRITMPAAKITAVASYNQSADGPYLRYHNVSNGYSVAGTGPGPFILEAEALTADEFIGTVLFSQRTAWLQTETFVLTGTDVTNEYVTLLLDGPVSEEQVVAQFDEARLLTPGIDIFYDPATKRLSWSSGVAATVSAGRTLVVRYL